MISFAAGLAGLSLNLSILASNSGSLFAFEPWDFKYLYIIINPCPDKTLSIDNSSFPNVF